ncbi:hypothetical protein [Sinobacterium caligoides]|nr:hypothetical protein [Sinobacterium caligoides]
MSPTKLIGIGGVNRPSCLTIIMLAISKMTQDIAAWAITAKVENLAS